MAEVVETCYYEEKEIDGIARYRTAPDASFVRRPVFKHPVDTLFFVVKLVLGVKTKNQMLEICGLHQGAVSRCRTSGKPLPPGMILNIHDATGISVDHIRKLAGVKKFNE